MIRPLYIGTSQLLTTTRYEQAPATANTFLKKLPCSTNHIYLSSRSSYPVFQIRSTVPCLALLGNLLGYVLACSKEGCTHSLSIAFSDDWPSSFSFSTLTCPWTNKRTSVACLSIASARSLNCQNNIKRSRSVSRFRRTLAPKMTSISSFSGSGDNTETIYVPSTNSMCQYHFHLSQSAARYRICLKQGIHPRG